jgi:hypothetical protein
VKVTLRLHGGDPPRSPLPGLAARRRNVCARLAKDLRFETGGHQNRIADTPLSTVANAHKPATRFVGVPRWTPPLPVLPLRLLTE